MASWLGKVESDNDLETGGGRMDDTMGMQGQAPGVWECVWPWPCGVREDEQT